MGKEPRKLFFRLSHLFMFLIVPPLLYVDILWLWRSHSPIQTEHRPRSSTTTVIINPFVKHKLQAEESLGFRLSRLVNGKERVKLKASGFVCDETQVYSKHCVASRPVMIDTATMTVIVPQSDQPPPPQDEAETVVIRPYARQEDKLLLKSVTPVKIQHHGNINNITSSCQHNHTIPAVVFSSSGFVGNIFHEINEILIPLFITTRQFRSRVLFIVEDYNPSFIRKYGKILASLTSNEIMNPAANASSHCFPGAVIGLKFHGHLAIMNSNDGLSMRDFRQLLRESLNLKYNHVSQTIINKGRPTVLLLSRRRTRRFLNEDEVVSVMEELGFRVIVIARAKVISDLDMFSAMINSCSVLVGAHGAGLTNQLFLPDGAVMVQVDLIGLEWAAATYYGNPARAMGIHYLRYKIQPEESSLLKVFYGQRNHTAITDPRALPVQAGKEVYLNTQNVRISVARFRETMVEAMSLVRDTAL